MTERRSKRSYRAAVVGLEERPVLAGRWGVAAEAVVAAAATGTTVPVPVSLAPGAYWKAQHNEYVARARHGGDAVVVLGDSLTYMWGDPRRRLSDPNPAFTPTGTDSWAATFAGRRAANFGIVGDKAQNLLWRVENGEIAGRPKVAVVLIGTNNVLHGDSTDAIAAGVAAVVGAIRKGSPRTRVLLLGILPPSPNPNDSARVVTREVNARLAWLAGGMVTYLDPGPAFLNPDGTARDELFLSRTDHLTAQGYAVLSSEVGPAVQALLPGPSLRRG